MLSLLSLPFGWKFSPVICQKCLAFFLSGLELGQVILLHYLDDLLFLGRDGVVVGKVARRARSLLVAAGFIISDKSVLEPTQHIPWLGKEFNLVEGVISNSEGSLAMAVAKWLVLGTGMCTIKLLRSTLGKLRWLGMPHMLMSPFLAGVYAHTLWGPTYLQATPVAILRAFASVIALAATGWSPPVGKAPFVWSWEGVLFVDAARQHGRFGYGLFGVSVGARFGWAGVGVLTQQCAELFALLAGVRLAANRGWHHLILFGDNVAAILQAVRLRAGVGLRTQQSLLRQIVYLVERANLRVYLCWTRSALMPADPVSRMYKDYRGSKELALEAAWRLFGELEASSGEVTDFGYIGEPRTREIRDRDRERWREIGRG